MTAPRPDTAPDAPYRRLPLAAVAVAVLAVAGAAPAARAAEAYDNCTGFIAAVPAVISSQGTWCFNKDLATASATGTAITVTTNNVIIDCNGFKLGNLGAGTATGAWGIAAPDRRNVTVRGCHIRGFEAGVMLAGTGGGHVVENNRIEAARVWGISVAGTNNIVRGNQLTDLGGGTSSADMTVLGINTSGPVEVRDNRLVGADASGTGSAYGIAVQSGAGSLVRGNTLRGIASPSGSVYGIYVSSADVSVRDNEAIGADIAGSVGIYCSGTRIAARDNTIGDFATAIGVQCTPLTDNVTY